MHAILYMAIGNWKPLSFISSKAIQHQRLQNQAHQPVDEFKCHKDYVIQKFVIKNGGQPCLPKTMSITFLIFLSIHFVDI